MSMFNSCWACVALTYVCVMVNTMRKLALCGRVSRASIKQSEHNGLRACSCF
jgi:hypothetical protein